MRSSLQDHRARLSATLVLSFAFFGGSLFASRAVFPSIAMFDGNVVRSTSPNSTQPDVPSFEIRSAPFVHFPGGHNDFRKADFFADSNSPSHWDGGHLYVINSWEQPWVASGDGLSNLGPGVRGKFSDPTFRRLWIWIESTYKAKNGTLYAWYHNEIPNRCPPRTDDIPGYPIVAKIGALESHDNGAKWRNLGFVLEPDKTAIDCATENQWYAGGVGDFSVTLDRAEQYFYFYYTNYPPEFSEQGICVARMKFADRFSPRGRVWIWRDQVWTEPGVGGHATPIWPASNNLTKKNGVTFWGPSIHWNTYLQQYVMLLNRIQDTSWSTEGIYISFNKDVSQPLGWSRPVKLLDRETVTHADPQKPGNGWYVQAMGVQSGETDKVAGQVARLFVDGKSRWEIVFSK